MELDPGPSSHSPYVASRDSVTAARAVADRLRAAAVAGRTVAPGEWADREQQALDALRAVAAFLRNHGNTNVARAITTALDPTSD